MSDTETNRRRLYTTLKTERGGGENLTYIKGSGSNCLRLDEKKKLKKTDKREMKKRLAAV